MRNLFIYLISTLICAGLVSCKGDYDDWAPAQENGQEDPVTIDFQVANPASTTIDLNTITTDSVEVGQIGQITVEEGGSYTLAVYAGKTPVGRAIDSESILLPNGINGNVIKVSKEDLEEAVWDLYGKAGNESHSINVSYVAVISAANGQASRLTGNEITFTATSRVLPIESNYYLVGDPNGWNQETTPQFTDLGNGLFELELTTTAEKQNIKIVPQSGKDAGGQAFWDSALGAKKGSTPALTGALAAKNKNGEPDAIIIDTPGKYLIELNMNDYTYTITAAFIPPTEMYIIGSPWSWDWNEVTVGMIPVHSTPGKFWRMQYLDASSQIKFFPVHNNWNNGIGYPEATIPTESINLAGLSDAQGNIGIANAGWYIIVIGADATGQYTVELLEPKVSLVGDAAPGGWNNIGEDPNNFFTVPTDENGEFVSPAFVDNKELRLCIKLENTDWWMTEFIIRNNVIEFRGNGGDQEPRINVTVGQKAYLNFSDNTGRIE